MAAPIWPAIVDEQLVEKLLPAIQQRIADICGADLSIGEDEFIPVAVGDLSNVLLMLLATVLEPLPQCSTPQGIRRLADAATRELALLIKDTKRLKLADQRPPGSLQ